MIILPHRRKAFQAGGGNGLLAKFNHYYKLEEASGTRVDETGNMDGAESSETIGNTAGESGNAALFVKADSSYINPSVGGILPGIPQTNYSIVGWANIDSLAERNEFVRASSVQIYYRSDVNFFIFSSGGTSLNLTSFSSYVTAGTTFHFACVRDETLEQVSIYIDGVLRARASDTNKLSGSYTSTFRIGNVISAYMNGWMDEVGFCNTELTDGGGLSVGDTAGGDILNLQTLFWDDFD